MGRPPEFRPRANRVTTGTGASEPRVRLFFVLAAEPVRSGYVLGGVAANCSKNEKWRRGHAGSSLALAACERQ
jgi:hypothetical protein